MVNVGRHAFREDRVAASWLLPLDPQRFDDAGRSGGDTSVSLTTIPDPGDRRAKLVRATDRGREVYVAITSKGEAIAAWTGAVGDGVIEGATN